MLGIDMFYGITAAKIVTVKKPSSATTYTSVWETAFRGNDSGGGGAVNTYSTLIVQNL